MSEHRKFCSECFEFPHECECLMAQPKEIEESEPKVGDDCPICMEALDASKNFAATECGHKFHLSCLMKSVVHNGFGCPYCRTKMADEPEPEQDEESVWSDASEEEEPFDDHALNGLRWMMMRLEGEEITEDDVEEEEEEEAEEEETPKPTVEFITQKLQEKRITMEDTVRALLIQHEEYADDREVENIDDRIFGEMRIIISNYVPEQVTN